MDIMKINTIKVLLVLNENYLQNHLLFPINKLDLAHFIIS